VFAPKENIPEGKNATFELNLLLNSTNFSSIYINEQLVFPDLTNYELIKETDTDYIYVNKEIIHYLNQDNFVEVDTTEDYIYQNMPGASVWANKKLNSVNINLKDYKKENTLINGTFRGGLKLAVYAEGELNVNFIKQDLNSYLGADEYNVTVTDSAGNVVLNRVYGDIDDKINSGRLGKEQRLNLNILHLKEGIYYIRFETDRYNDATDSTLKNINVNTNKVLILGTFLPLRPFNFYTKTSFKKVIGLSYWLSGKDQIVHVIGTKEEKINLGKDLINKRYDKNLTKGEYNIIIDKSYLWVYNDFSSLSKSCWFDIPVVQQDNFYDSNIIVFNKSSFDQLSNYFSYSQDINFSQNKISSSLKILNSNSASFKNAKLSLK
jgi:hypothetical protein